MTPNVRSLSYPDIYPKLSGLITISQTLSSIVKDKLFKLSVKSFYLNKIEMDMVPHSDNLRNDLTAETQRRRELILLQFRSNVG
jgi:hypothetical protein